MGIRMNKILLAAAAGLAAIVAGAPAASAQVYGGVGYTAFMADAGGEDLVFGGVLGRAGFKFNPLLGVEGEFAIGANDDSVDVGGTDVDFGLDSGFGAYAVGWLPIPLIGDLFGRVGYADLSFEASGGGFTANEGGSGLAYGGGVQFSILIAKLRAEYTRYELDDDAVDSLGVSALLQF
jgi:hypothetical protein